MYSVPAKLPTQWIKLPNFCTHSLQCRGIKKEGEITSGAEGSCNEYIEGSFYGVQFSSWLGKMEGKRGGRADPIFFFPESVLLD